MHHIKSGIKVVSAFALVAAVAGSPLEAQTCLGFASFRNQPVSLGLGLQARDETGSAFAEMGAGSPMGFFGLARAGVSGKSDHKFSFDDLDDDNDNDIDQKSSFAGVRLGFDIAVDSRNRTSICPMVNFEHQFGPNIPASGSGGSAVLRQKAHGDVISGGVAIGGDVLNSRTTSLIPSLAFEMISARAGSSVFAANGNETKRPDQTDSYAQVTVGLGIVIHKRFTIHPFAAFPVGLDNGEGIGGLMFRANLGGN